MYCVLSDSHLFLISLSVLFFFFFVATFVAAFFSFICLFCLELSPKSFSSFLFSQTWINTLKHHFPFPLPFLFYFHIFSPFCPNIIIFPSAFAAILLFHELSCPFLVFCTLAQGRLNKDLGLFFLNSAKLDRNYLKNVWYKLCPDCPVAWGWLGANKFLFSKFNFS